MTTPDTLPPRRYPHLSRDLTIMGIIFLTGIAVWIAPAFGCAVVVVR